MKKKVGMIAAAGRGSRMLSLTENNPKAMLPFNNKPIIAHHLDYLISEGFEDAIVIVGYKKEKLIDYVNKFYSDKIKVRFAEQKSLNGLAGAIKCGLDITSKTEQENSTLFIMLGDLVLHEPMYEYHFDFVGFDIVDDWSRWCMVRFNGEARMIELIDKPEEKPNTDKNLMGLYNIANVPRFSRNIDIVINRGDTINNEFQISQVLELYNEYHPMTGIYVKDYSDMGDLDSLNKTRKNITRHFNSIKVTDNNTVLKTSENKKKLQQEVDWYENIHRKLSLYTPHLVDHDETGYELEFIHSNPLQELFLFSFPEINEWKSIFNNIKRFIDLSKDTTFAKLDLSSENEAMLVTKTKERVEKVKELNFAKEEFVIVNNLVYKNPVFYIDDILKLTDLLFVTNNSSEYFSHLHGDLFFGNMLYDVNTNVLKVIDPRGYYGGLVNHGDIRYDIAKLNHSVDGLYDFIVNGLYFLEQDGNKYDYHFYESNQDQVKNIFEETILKDYNKHEIDLLTGLLFLTMIPLHSENPKNQKMQFIRAVEYLNKFI